MAITTQSVLLKLSEYIRCGTNRMRVHFGAAKYHTDDQYTLSAIFIHCLAYLCVREIVFSDSVKY